MDDNIDIERPTMHEPKHVGPYDTCTHPDCVKSRRDDRIACAVGVTIAALGTLLIVLFAWFRC